MSRTDSMIRDADPEIDLPGITEIYNDAVEHSTAIWNDTSVDIENRAAWLAEHERRGFPVLVAVGETGGADGSVGSVGVLGYATFGDFRPFEGYRHTVEHSVYVRSDQRGRGLGEALMLALIERARGLGVHVMVAAVESGNATSIRLHERLGFERAGMLREVGCKFGRWLDLVYLELRLAETLPSR